VREADWDLDFQRHCLPYLDAAVKRQDASAADLATLIDCIRLAEGRKQLYGTQVYDVKGQVVPRPIENEDSVDIRRAQLNLPPLKAYLEFVDKVQSSVEPPAALGR